MKNKVYYYFQDSTKRILKSYISKKQSIKNFNIKTGDNIKSFSQLCDIENIQIVDGRKYKNKAEN